jgi:hypothetical protein
MTKILHFLFGCHHDWSWPRTRYIQSGNQKIAQTYQVCSKCGQEAAFSLRQWKQTDRIKTGLKAS